MRVNILLVCIDNGCYADHLEKSLPVWMKHAASVTVVTDLKDERTPIVAHKYGALLHRTNIFYEDGRLFGKYAAMEEARVKVMPYYDWILFTDADILPPDDWLEQIKKANPSIGDLYGCSRVMDSGKVTKAVGEIAGFFQLFHVDDPSVRQTPILNPAWLHCGNGDSELAFRWPPENRIHLPIEVRHFGPDGVNWCGADKPEEMIRIRIDRQKGRNWRSEVIRKEL